MRDAGVYQPLVEDNLGELGITCALATFFTADFITNDSEYY